MMREEMFEFLMLREEMFEFPMLREEMFEFPMLGSWADLQQISVIVASISLQQILVSFAAIIRQNCSKY